jgi:hypothetical protein
LTWHYDGKELEEPPDDAFGFVYLIECTKNGKKYYGKKLLTKAGYKQVKGKRKKIRKESDWKTYFGSSKELLSDVGLLGEKHFKRTILRFCKTRGECNYFESKFILESDAILSDKYYNDWISVKVSSSHLKNIKIA